MPKGLALKLILFITIFVVAIEGFSAYFRLRQEESQIIGSMITGADQLSRSIASATWLAMLADQRAAAYEVMRTIAQKQGIDRIRIFNKEGRIMFSTDPESGRMVDTRAEACTLCHAREQPLVRVDVPTRARTFRGVDGRRRLGMVTPLYNEPACSTAACHAHPPGRKVLGVLDVTLSLDPVDRELATSQRRTVLLVIAEVLALAVFITMFIRHTVHKPIKVLKAGTRAVSAMQLDRPIEIRSADELGELAAAFDLMRERLRKAVRENEEFTQVLETRVQERTDQLRTAQQKLVQSDRLASLGRLSASVAHEINNPISGVLNLSMLMQRILKDDGIPPGRVGEFRGYLGQVTHETTRVGRIVSDLLSFSRRARPQGGSADLNFLVRSTVSLIDHKMALSGVRLDLSLAEGLSPVACDGSQLQQVVMNLVLNAVESIQGEGTVSVSTRPLPAEGQVELEVKDTGAGIPPEILNQIFEPFFTTKEGKGLGLGLAVAYGIVAAHGGDIDVSSELGRGTTFRVLLKAAPAPDGDRPARPGAAAGSERRP